MYWIDKCFGYIFSFFFFFNVLMDLNLIYRSKQSLSFSYVFRRLSRTFLPCLFSETVIFDLKVLVFFFNISNAFVPFNMVLALPGHRQTPMDVMFVCD